MAESPKQFTFLQPVSEHIKTDTFFDDVVNDQIQSHKPHLILLDLRLQNEKGVRIDAEMLSGGVLLANIRKQYPGLPVLMTTASNKSWSYEELQRLGCDAFWTKEGIDAHLSTED
ncbi:MAG: response regulator [Bacteroidetes bacterium]|nr:response regulator [Bacteroidota bacterium]